MINLDLKRALKSRAHPLKPIILLGQHGLTDAVLKEIEIALQHHELMKIKLPQIDRDARQLIITEILEKTHADLVQSMGRIATIYKEREDGLSTASTKTASKNKGVARSGSRN